uniref:Intraflagellar transport protein 46 homolog n=1 Tax=Plectus sambesii TaxID=2011161 RepID=A0A914WQG1_9BILA
MANRPSSVGGRGGARPVHIGQPISDSSSSDGEDDQIQQLNEEHGIDQHYPEVDVPPKDEEDDPIGGLDDEPDPPDLPDGDDRINAQATELEDYEDVDQSNPTSGAPQARSAFGTELDDNEQTYDGQQLHEEEEVVPAEYGDAFDPPNGPPPPYDIGGDSPEQNPLAEEEDSSYAGARPFANEASADSRKSLWDEDPVDHLQEEEDAYSRPINNQPLDEDDSNGLEHKSIPALQPVGGRALNMDVKDGTNAQAHAPHIGSINRGHRGEDGEGEGSEEEYSEAEPHAVEGAYDANEYTTLPVGSDVKELFQFIDAYQPQTVEIEPMLKPFILDYIPAVGDIDAFIKIPRPDDVEDNLGLLVLDEPSAKQSDPTILDLQMRAMTKEGAPKDTVVKRLERADKNSKEIEQWITNIGELHRSKPATNVHYSKPMPDIDLLMQEWPPEVEAMLKRVELPSADMDVSVEQYVDIVLNFLDIPVHKSRIQSLHVLFTLYSEFKNSQHFRNLAEKNELDNEPRGEPEPDRLVL